MSKKPPKTDFIDLDEKDFKKKGINIKFLFFIFLILIIVFTLIFYKRPELLNTVFIKENKETIQSKKNSEENKLNFVLKEEFEVLDSRNKEMFATIESVDVIQNNLKVIEQNIKILSEELKKDFEGLKNIQIDKLSPQMLDIVKGKEKNVLLYMIIDNLEEKIYFDNEFLVFFNKIKSSFSDNRMISRSLKEIEDLKFFNKLGELDILSNFDINIGIHQKDLINLSHFENYENIEINSAADLKKYLIDLVSGLVVIRKIDSALESESIYNLDSKLDTQKKLLAAKNFFLVKNLVKSLKEIQSINEPNSGNIKLLEEYLFELIKIQQILKKLKLDVMSYDNNS